MQLDRCSCTEDPHGHFKVCLKIENKKKAQMSGSNEVIQWCQYLKCIYVIRWRYAPGRSEDKDVIITLF